MRAGRVFLILLVATLAMVPVGASAGGKHHTDRHGPAVHDGHGGANRNADVRAERKAEREAERAARKAERERERAERKEERKREAHERRCTILESKAPEKWAELCNGGEGNTPPEPDPTDPPPDPEPEDPAPSPTGMANFATIGAIGFAYSASAGPEAGVSSGPPDANPASSEFAWSDGVFPLTFARFAGSFMEFRVHTVSNVKSATATCAWDTLQIALLDGPPGASAELRNVVLDGVAVGDLIDNGDGVPESDFWTFRGLDLAPGFTLTADLVVSGWAAETATPARAEFTVGCGA